MTKVLLAPTDLTLISMSVNENKTHHMKHVGCELVSMTINSLD